MGKRTENFPMVPIPIQQPFRVKLLTQEKRKPLCHLWLQLQTLNYPVTTNRHGRQEFPNSFHSLVVRCVHAERLSADYSGG